MLGKAGAGGALPKGTLAAVCKAESKRLGAVGDPASAGWLD